MSLLFSAHPRKSCAGYAAVRGKKRLHHATFLGFCRHLEGMDTRLHITLILGILGIFSASAPAAMVAMPQDPYGARLSCPADAVIPAVRNENGITLTQVPGGVTGKQATLIGKVAGGNVTGLLVHAQHDRTKAVTFVATKGALKPDGQFEITVPLAQYGSYTIVIQVLRVGAAPAIISVRTSRVIAPHDLTAAAVTMDAPAGDHLMIAVDLEKSCRALAKSGLPKDCDLIGSQTGATQVRATNRISSGREVKRVTNVGSEGKYSLCVPLGDGENQIEVSVCNAALPQCMILTTKTFSFSKPEPRVEFLDRDPAHLQFTIKDWAPPKSDIKACEGEIELEWNREAKQKLCPSNGVYSIPNQPVVGVNEMGIGEFRFTFGWGEAVWARDFARSVQAVAIDHAVIDRHLKGILNKFLESDQFPKVLASFLSGGSDTATNAPVDANQQQELAEIRASIPGCVAAVSPVRTKVVGTPKIGRVYLESAVFSSGQLAMALTVEQLQAAIQIYKDADQDGRPDKGILPLRIAFKTLSLRPIFKIQQNPTQVLLTTDVDDCSFKPASYCNHQPAFFHPGAMTGEATKGGAIVACDSEGQLGGEDLVQGCIDLNIVNMQTGQLSATVIDTLNTTLYCDVSAQLTYALRHAGRPIAQDFSVLDRKFTWAMRVGLDPEGLQVGADGIRLSLGTQMEGGGFYYRASPATTELTAPTGAAFGLALREDLINQALAALVNLGKPGEGLLDWTFDEQSIAAMGFDFATECSAVPSNDKPKSPLCELRPTVGQLLGTALETTGYYSKNQALRVTLKGDRTLAPHLRFRKSDAGEMVVDLDIPNLEIAFEAEQPIIKARVTILLSVTLEKIATSAKDPSKLALQVRLRPQESRIVIAPVAGSNKTLLPDAALLGKLRDLAKWGLTEAAKPERTLPPIEIPKKFRVPTAPLGIDGIQFYDGHLQWGIDPFAHAFTLTADPVFIQRLLVDGEMQEYRWGE